MAGWINSLTTFLAEQYNAATTWVADQFQPLIDWLEDAFTQLTEFLYELGHEILLGLLRLVLDVCAAIINAIPAPEFLSDYNLGSVLGQGGPWAAWVIGMIPFDGALALIAAAWAFRLVRKILTLGQW